MVAWALWNVQNSQLHGEANAKLEMVLVRSMGLLTEFVVARNELGNQISLQPTVQGTRYMDVSSVGILKINCDTSV